MRHGERGTGIFRQGLSKLKQYKEGAFMGYTIGKRMTAMPPRATPEPGGAPFLSGLPKVGSVLTMNTGVWNGHPPFNPKFQWYSGVSSIANATNQSFSVQSAGNYFLTCRMSMGNQKYGTTWRDGATGTIIP